MSGTRDTRSHSTNGGSSRLRPTPKGTFRRGPPLCQVPVARTPLDAFAEACDSFHCLRSLSLAHSVRLSCGLHRRRRQRQIREHHILFEFVATHTCSRLYTASYTGESTCNTSGTSPGPSLQQAHVLDDLHHEQVPAPATPAVASEAQVMQPTHVRCSRRSTS